MLHYAGDAVISLYDAGSDYEAPPELFSHSRRGSTSESIRDDSYLDDSREREKDRKRRTKDTGEKEKDRERSQKEEKSSGGLASFKEEKKEQKKEKEDESKTGRSRSERNTESTKENKESKESKERSAREVQKLTCATFTAVLAALLLQDRCAFRFLACSPVCAFVCG